MSCPEHCAQGLHIGRVQYRHSRSISSARRLGGKHRQNIRPGGRLSLDFQRVISTLRLHTGDLLPQFAIDLRYRLGWRDGPGCFIRPAKKMPSGEARMTPHRQTTTTTAITTPPPAVAAAARALAAPDHGAERTVCRLCGLPGGHTGRLCGLLGSCQPGSSLRRTAGLSGRKRSYRRFPTWLSNSSRFANGMASRFDRHASFFYCRLCGAAHSLPGGFNVRPGLHTRTAFLPRHLP